MKWIAFEKIVSVVCFLQTHALIFFMQKLLWILKVKNTCKCSSLNYVVQRHKSHVLEIPIRVCCLFFYNTTCKYGRKTVFCVYGKLYSNKQSEVEYSLQNIYKAFNYLFNENFSQSPIVFQISVWVLIFILFHLRLF